MAITDLSTCFSWGLIKKSVIRFFFYWTLFLRDLQRLLVSLRIWKIIIKCIYFVTAHLNEVKLIDKWEKSLVWIVIKLGQIHSNFGFSNLEYWIWIPNMNLSLRNYTFDSRIWGSEFGRIKISKILACFRPKNRPKIIIFSQKM